LGELDINEIRILLLLLLIFTISSCVGTAAQVDVKPGDSIQDAVNSAHSGDTILVEPGTYVGNIDISKSNDLNNLVLMSANGDPSKTTIIANNSASDKVLGVISISNFKTNVTVKGFTISEARDSMAGVYLDQGKQCTIENNVFLNDGSGVKVHAGSGNTISNNIVSRTKAVVSGTEILGISIDGSGNTIVSQNSVSNQGVGIHFSGSSSKGSSISGNSVNKNAEYGIELENSAKGITVEGNTLDSNNLIGIYLSSSSENSVTNNDVVMPGILVNGVNTNAIVLYSESQSDTISNIVSNNSVSNADHGIFLNGCKNNTIKNNRASGNNYGIAMRYSHNNRVINNNADGNTNGNNSEGIYLTLQDSENTVSGNGASGCGIGIHLSDTCGENNLVDNNVVNSNTYNGIYVEAPNNKISKNFASANGRGIFLTGPRCSNNMISSNNVNNSIGHGIYLLNTSNDNELVINSLISNSNSGIQLFHSNNSYLDSNYAQENGMGIQEENSNGVTVNNNTVFHNRIGIRLHYSENNTLSMNNATYSDESGIDMNSAVNNTVAGNLITWNDKGITMCPACRKNLIYNNYFNNNVNTDIKNADNEWYIEKTKGKNIVHGPYIGGNFWALPGGDGFSQTAPDMNGDGLADTIYTYTSQDGITITDNLPLVNVVLPVPDFSINPAQGTAPLTVNFTDLSQNEDSRIWNFGDGTNSTDPNPTHTYSTVGTYTVSLTASNKNDSEPKFGTVTVQAYVPPPVTPINPVADFNANPTEGYAPLTVQFTDSSQNAVGWNWDFGDGAKSNDQNPEHTYSAEGTYNVNLVASNTNGTSSKTATITVQSQTSHSSGGGGGGGAGGSPEPQSNVEIKELSQAFITSGKHVNFDFPQKTTPVVYISFDSKKTVGKTTTIAEMLKTKSTLTSDTPTGEIYKYLNIWVGNGGYATPTNIENAVVSFKVEKSWVQDKKIDKSSIILSRYSDKKWNQLPTALSSGDDKYLCLTAQTPGFSPFAITGNSTETGTIQPLADKTQTANVNETHTETNSGSTVTNTDKKPQQKESPNTPGKGSTNMPGFEAVFGVVSLLAVFLYKLK
jgi:PGF-pre-PGF domain-containing protein